MASMAWLWGNDMLSDMQLQLCTTQPASADCCQEEELPLGSSTVTADEAAEGRGKRAAATSPDDAGRRKAARLDDSLSAPAAATTAALEKRAAPTSSTFRLHANVLASSSAYFKTRIARHIAGRGSDSGGGQLCYADTGGGAGSAADQPASGLLLVEHVEEGERDAMEAVLRHCYTSQLCGAGGNAAQVTVAVLLQMLLLSDRFDVPLCSAHCCEELARRKGAGDYDLAAINAVLAGSPAGWQALPAFRAVIDTATAHLLAALGDAEAFRDGAYSCAPDGAITGAAAAAVNAGGAGGAALGAPPWDSQLQQLSLPSLLVLLHSDGLRCRSENSVLLLAHQWVCGGSGGRPEQQHCSDADARAVAGALRLCRLSHAYLFDVLPRLGWLQMTAEERESLLLFVAAGAAGAAAAAVGALKPPKHSDRQELLLRRGQLAGPAGWYSAPQRAPPPAGGALIFQWEVPSDDLAHLLQLAGTGKSARLSSREHFFAGFAVKLILNMSAKLGIQGCLYCKARLDLPGIDRPVLRSVMQIRRMHAQNGRVSRLQKEKVAVHEGGGMPVKMYDLFKHHTGPRSDVLRMASWEPLLVEGRLQVGLTVKACE